MVRSVICIWEPHISSTILTDPYGTKIPALLLEISRPSSSPLVAPAPVPVPLLQAVSKTWSLRDGPRDASAQHISSTCTAVPWGPARKWWKKTWDKKMGGVSQRVAQITKISSFGDHGTLDVCCVETVGPIPQSSWNSKENDSRPRGVPTLMSSFNTCMLDSEKLWPIRPNCCALSTRSGLGVVSGDFQSHHGVFYGTQDTMQWQLSVGFSYQSVCNSQSTQCTSWGSGTRRECSGPTHCAYQKVSPEWNSFARWAEENNGYHGYAKRCEETMAWKCFLAKGLPS